MHHLMSFRLKKMPGAQPPSLAYPKIARVSINTLLLRSSKRHSKAMQVAANPAIIGTEADITFTVTNDSQRVPDALEALALSRFRSTLTGQGHSGAAPA